ncbi:VOC family protein [Virgibacillus sp. YIM 98842]|uniref:VOC family protein n=1 Tax=Virgibacillus sp. YIM 98842 TaxID=2663533 RepID=UPI0013DB0BD8|nr:VOC family protein [Virgibacillus sp. YIM 98842]
MLALDHLIITAKDPEKAAKDFGEKHDVTVLEGGKHDNWGTYNYLAYFANDSYIEWIGIFDEDLAEASDNPLIMQTYDALSKGHEAFIQFAVRTEKMDDFIEHFQQTDVNYKGPFAGSRQRPDGSRLEWRMLFPEAARTTLPFILEWGKTKNVPQDKALLNNKRIEEVTLNMANKDLFHKIFILEASDDIIQLGNSRLKFIEDNQHRLGFSYQSY